MSKCQFSIHFQQSSCRVFFLGVIIYRKINHPLLPVSDAATVTMLVNNVCIQSRRPRTDSSPLTHRWKSHSFLEPRPSLWINSSSSSPMSSLGFRCTGWWTGRAISSTPLKTLRYNQPELIKKGIKPSTHDTLYGKKFNHWWFCVFLPCSALQRDSFELLSKDDPAEHNGSHSLWISETGLFFPLLYFLV